jgi:hypothetical protein
MENTELMFYIFKLMLLERDYSKDSKASKRCFCNQFEKVCQEYAKRLEETSHVNH